MPHRVLESRYHLTRFPKLPEGPPSHLTRRLQVSLDSRSRPMSFAEIVQAVNGEFE